MAPYDPSRLVVYVTYAQGDSSPIWYRRILISDAGAVTVGSEQPTGAQASSSRSVRPVIARDRNGRVHIAYRRDAGVISLIGTTAQYPGDTPAWSSSRDVLISPEAVREALPVLLPFGGGGGGGGNLLGLVSVARAGGFNTILARDITGFDGTTYSLGAATATLGSISKEDVYLSLSGVVDSDNVAHILYVKGCPDSGTGSCPGSPAGSATGAYARRAAAPGTVETWAAATQVAPHPNGGAITTASLSLEPVPHPDRLYAFFGTNTGAVAFKSSPSDLLGWGAAGCAGMGGTVNGSQCDLLTYCCSASVGNGGSPW